MAVEVSFYPCFSIHREDSARVKNHLGEIRGLLKDARLNDHSTQAGFAKLVGCSVALIRAVEQGKAPISDKLASKIEQRLGIQTAWLLDPASSSPPQDVDGTITTPEMVKQRLVAQKFIAAPVRLPSLALQGKVVAAIQQTQAAIFEDLSRGDETFLEELFALLGKREVRLKPSPEPE